MRVFISLDSIDKMGISLKLYGRPYAMVYGVNHIAHTLNFYNYLYCRVTLVGCTYEFLEEWCMHLV